MLGWEGGGFSWCLQERVERGLKTVQRLSSCHNLRVPRWGNPVPAAAFQSGMVEINCFT